MFNRSPYLTIFLLLLCTASLEAQEFFSPTEYRAFSHPNAGTAVSPFKDLAFGIFHLEDFEDGLLNTPGVSVREFTTTNIQIAFSDSVDGDDGTIDGFATGNTTSLFSNLSTSSFTFDFNRNGLGGQLPTHVGIVWTDVGRNGGGTPSSADRIDNTTFEAFDSNGDSLGLFGPFSLGDASISRTTEEDRFIGFANPDGISFFRISMPGRNNWEVDHLQYGVQCVLGDVNMNGVVDFLDIAPFIAVLAGGTFQCEADCDRNGVVDFLDISAFVEVLSRQ